MRYIILLFLLLASWVIPAQGADIDQVLVKKSELKMYLISDSVKIKEYSIALGGNPKGHKEQEGDERTPEGKYILDYKKADSSF